jgi:hypothetical protein
MFTVPNYGAYGMYRTVWHSSIEAGYRTSARYFLKHGTQKIIEQVCGNQT